MRAAQPIANSAAAPRRRPAITPISELSEITPAAAAAPAPMKGSEQSFTTSDAPPSIDAESTLGAGQTEVRLEAEIDPFGQETSYSFECSTSEGLAGAQVASGTMSVPVSGLGVRCIRQRP